MARLATLIAIALAASQASAAEIRGRIRVSAEFQLPPLFAAPGYWQLHNNLVKVQPPMVDPRMEMVVELLGSGLPSKTLIKPVIRISDARFLPPVLPVKPDTKITVRNDGAMAHLLQSKGLRVKRVAPGDRLVHRFSKEGSHRITCTEVPHLVAEVFVTKAPLATLPDATGSFSFPGIPSGSYILRIWHRGEMIYREPVAATGITRVDVRLKQREKNGKDEKDTKNEKNEKDTNTNKKNKD